MKKIGLMVLLVMASLSTAFAQKIAVLDFKAGVGITQTDVDGLSSTFVTYFNPRGYQLVERSQINQVIEEQGFQQTSLTESQMVRLGQILNLSKIVVGDVNIVGGSPNLDVRVIDVQSGEVTGRDGATFAWTNYRTTMQQLAQKVASQIGVVYGGNGLSGNGQSTGKSPSGKVETILGYLQVYPEDLGSFSGCPNSVIAAINRQKLYDFGDWRLPTNEELSLMATSKEKLGMGNVSSYMSKENANSGGMKIVRLVRSDDTNGGSSVGNHTVVVIRTSLGIIKARLYDDTPLHRDNFIKLVNEGWYNGSPFHRVIKNFMVQGGQNANGRLDPGYTIPAEFRDSHFHKKGALAAARQGDQVNPNKASSGSQFYIVQGKVYDDHWLDMFESRSGKVLNANQRQTYKTIGGTPHLDGDYTVFGEVIEGLEVVDMIASVETGNMDVPIKPVIINSVTIEK